MLGLKDEFPSSIAQFSYFVLIRIHSMQGSSSEQDKEDRGTR